MKDEFWKQKWERREIAFHEGETNYFLKKYFYKLRIPIGSRVFVPLCGKTRDISWLLNQGYKIVGAELSDIAIQELFQELGLDPLIEKRRKLVHYHAENIEIYVGNIFDLRKDTLGFVNAVYDRAALVALPSTIRAQYVTHLLELAPAASQLLISYEYNQELVDGPPFSITKSELTEHYGKSHEQILLETRELEGGMKGKAPSVETAWLLLYRNEH